MIKDELIDYFDKELSYLREEGLNYAKLYPKVAGNLELQSSGSSDPHIELLLQGFAFLTARIQKKLDDSFPEITEAMLNVLHPQLLAPMPSASIVQFLMDNQSENHTKGINIARHTNLFSPPSSGLRCQFRTCYDTTLWPIKVEDANLSSPQSTDEPPQDSQSVLQITLTSSRGTALRDIAVKELRFYLDGPDKRAHRIHQYLIGDACRLHVRLPGGSNRTRDLGPARKFLRPVGFEQQQSLSEYGPHSSLSRCLLIELFLFPQKFLFFDLHHMEKILKHCEGDSIELLIYSSISPPPCSDQVDKKLFKLGCSPIVNLFKKIAEPIRVDHTNHSYRVIPDKFKYSMIEVHSIQSVQGLSSAPKRQTTYHPFYSVEHDHSDSAQSKDNYYYAKRSENLKSKGERTELLLTLVDLAFDLHNCEAETLRVDTLCTNHDLPSKLPFGGINSDLNADSLPVQRITCLIKATPSVRLSLGSDQHWRLISSLSLKHLSLDDPNFAHTALKETLRLYNFGNNHEVANQIEGIVAIHSRPIAARINTQDSPNAYVRGTEIELILKPENYVGGGAFLLAQVIDHYLSLNVPFNAFSKLIVKFEGHDTPLYQGLPRSGELKLL